MAYLFNNQPYENQASVIDAASEGLEARVSWADVEPQTQVLAVIEPDHNPETQRTVWTGGALDAAAMTYTLAVVERVWFARIGDRDTVQEISEHPDEYRTWAEIPSEMLTWVKSGWLYQDDTFAPANMDSFRLELTVKVEEAADDYHRVVLFGSGAENPSQEKKDRFENNLRIAEKHRLGESGYSELLQIQLDQQKSSAAAGIASDIWESMDVGAFAGWIIDWQPMTDKAGALIEAVRLYGITQTKLLTDPQQATLLMQNLKTLADTALGLLMQGKNLTEIRAVIDPMMSNGA